MIASSLTYTSNAGVSVSLFSTTYPVENYEHQTYQVNDPVRKVQFPGRWPTFSYPEYMEVHVSGDILGDTAADYNTKVRALKAAINPPYKTVTSRRQGTLTAVFFGDATTYYAYVILSSLLTPKEANYPSVGTFEVTWISFEPYWINQSTGAPATDI